MLRKMHVRDILKFGTESVKSDVLMKNFVKPLDRDMIQVEKYEYHLHKNLHIVGFGKAVTGMCSAIEKVVSDHLRGGLLSIPNGSGQSYLERNPNSKIKVFEGAKNNLPDNDALNTAKSIYEYVYSLSPSDLLFVLISGRSSS